MNTYYEVTVIHAPMNAWTMRLKTKEEADAYYQAQLLETNLKVYPPKMFTTDQELVNPDGTPA